ncbi:centrosomal protein of 290 kDa [Biomphalaria glabrata]|nr:centrosomal protein of 290 kDa [Biomphalaria glabrata]
MFLSLNLQISAQNIHLKQKYLYLKRKTSDLMRQLDELTKEEGQGKPLKVLMKHAASQTEVKNWKSHYVSQPRKPEPVVLSETDVLKTKKVLEMHSSLLQRYDKEVKLNMSYADTISELNVKLGETEQRLREEKEKCIRLERELIAVKGKQMVCEDPVLRDVVGERNKLAKENRRLKEELKGLDHNFFDEIEDLKFALLQSAKLNNGYEKELNKLCSQLGLPVPAPEKILFQKTLK